VSTQAFEITKTEIVPTSSGKVWYEYLCVLGQDIERLLFYTCHAINTVPAAKLIP